MFDDDDNGIPVIVKSVMLVLKIARLAGEMPKSLRKHISCIILLTAVSG